MGRRIAAAALLLAGCSGTMQGVTRGTEAPVQFSYVQGPESDRLAAVIDGERFGGRTEPAGAAADPAALDGLLSSFFLGMDSGAAGEAGAIMRGDRGSSLDCLLHYADGTRYTPSGGTGLCRHSDGRLIDIAW
ncbi:hypothetical protein [Mangrovicoccus sp. HB161399]|uniref:hypothetical protein n=1 Tax=Mangrovicoccus sp. HB161399 TaxID=2720392 RepID=UPI0015546E57|nr:hypothetical protein [Mangrovicoccus sp. HB161399]